PPPSTPSPYTTLFRSLEPLDRQAVLMVRPRGWHLDEKHVQIDGQPVSGSLFDAAVYLCNNAAALVAQGRVPCLYLPKLESMEERSEEHTSELQSRENL